MISAALTQHCGHHGAADVLLSAMLYSCQIIKYSISPQTPKEIF